LRVDFGIGMSMVSSTPASVWVVITAFNESSVISDVVAGLNSAEYKVLVVDDASTDDTAQRAEAAGARVLQHPINLGQGAALQTGISFALRRGADFIVTFDGDGQHRAEDVPALINALVTQQVDFALGSRFLGSALNLPPSRKLLLRAATWFTRLTTGLKLTDAHNGLRAMTRRGASALKLRQNRMAHASEIPAQIARSGLGYVEVPVTIVYTQYSLQKGQRVSNSVSILIDLLAGRLQR
jgi:glycosyltransferase involved in cell wall biosynthesis